MHKLMLLITGAAVMSLAIIVVGDLNRDIRADKAATQAFMRQKLNHAQSALEGITLEKFDLVAKSALRLRDMTHTNIFVVLKTPDYRQHTLDYQKNIEALFQAATDNNLDAASEAYQKVTRSCVDCHRYFRKAQRSKSVVEGSHT